MRKRSKGQKLGKALSMTTASENGEQKVEGRKPYDSIIRENDSFIAYYKAQNVCPVDEWDSFIHSLKSDLPTTFRITANKDEAQAMLKLVEGEFLQEILQNNTEDVDKPNAIANLFPLPWYPDKMAWQLELSRKDIRRDERYWKLHNFLISETENGTISRQETVSMIPPLVLDVQPHHKTLDMCAAPGSKTAQLIELLHKNEAETGVAPTGFVVANDVDNKRCYMLVHQAKRLNSPCIAIINHDAAILPNLLDANKTPIQFDRILCDVPCSGDGTMRKNPDIWMKWTPANGLNQHGIQIRIAKRAAELLAVGGRMVYSTCSINPIENEAVIHRLLVETQGALKLIDVKDSLPGLKYIPGMETWKVSSRNLEFYDKWEDVDIKWQTTIRPPMFPPGENASEYGLNKCIRILPNMQDTGAFFVAVLEKVSTFPKSGKNVPETEKKETDNKAEEGAEQIEGESKQEKTGDDVEQKQEDEVKEPPYKRRKKSYKPDSNRRGYKEDPFVFFEESETVWPSIKEFYGISDTFDPTCLLTRCNVGKKKNIYYTCAPVRDLILGNRDRVKFINTGVKAFVRSDNRHMKCAFRLANEGLESILPVIGPERKLTTISKEDMIALLNTTDSVPITELQETFRKDVEKLGSGSCVLVFQGDDLKLNLVGWRGVNSFRCYIGQNNTVHLLRLLGGDISRFNVNKYQKTSTPSDG